MKINFICKLIFFFFLLSEIKTDEDGQPEPKSFDFDFTFTDTGRKSQTIDLRDSNFDSIIQNGNHNRWLIIFYSERNDFCKKVKSLIDKIIEEKKYKNVNNIKFASVNIDYNLRLLTRFNISGIPVLFLVENNKMLEISNFPLEDNLIHSIEIENINTKELVRDFPAELPFTKFIKNLFLNSLKQVKNMVNNYLKKNNINFEFTLLTFFLCILFMCVLVTALLVLLIIKCFCKEMFTLKKDKEIKNEEIEYIIEENKNNNADNEEAKKIIEEKKEKEMKEKLIKETMNKYNKEQQKKKEKKKKKE